MPCSKSAEREGDRGAGQCSAVRGSAVQLICVLICVLMQVCATQAATASQATFPTIYREMQDALTGYGLGMMAKQMATSSKYGARVVDLTALEDSTFAEQEDNPFVETDPDVLDHRRFETAAELRSSLEDTVTGSVKVYQVDILHTVTARICSPHFVVLHDKVEGREAYKQYLCTCGSGIRCGVPCRHYWAVLRHSTAPAFHRGLVNDLWFKTAQPVGVSVVNMHLFDDPEAPREETVYYRPLYAVPPGEAHLEETEKMEELARDLSLKRKWGALLGEAKKAIERALQTGAEDGLYATLRGFGGSDGMPPPTLSAGRPSSGPTTQVRNPEVVRGKGRPKGTIRVGAGSSQGRQPRVPLRILPRNVPTGDMQAGEDAGNGSAPEAPGGAESRHGDPAAGPAKRVRKLRKCGCCGNMAFHNARTCPEKEGAPGAVA